MPVDNGHTPLTPFIKGVTDTPYPHYARVLAQLREATRNVSRSNMTIGEYRAARRLLLSLEDGDGETCTVRDPRMHNKVLRAFREFKQKLKRSAEPRIRESCENALLSLWKERGGRGRPDEQSCLFVVSNFQSFWEPSVRDELSAYLPIVTRSAAGETANHRLLETPAWFHELLEFSWRRKDSSWYAFATDVPDGAPVLGPGTKIFPTDADEAATIVALWSDDPTDEYFLLGNVVEAARLL